MIGRAGLTPAFTVPQARKRLLSRNFSTPRLKRRLVYFALRPMAPPNRVERLLTGSEPVVQAATPEGYIMAALAGIEPTTTESWWVTQDLNLHSFVLLIRVTQVRRVTITLQGYIWKLY